MTPVRRLPVRPDLDQLKRQAKHLLRAMHAGDAAAIGELREHHPDPIDPASAKLARAQFVLARSYQATSRTRLVQAVRLATAICRDDLNAVRDLVNRNYNLLHEPVLIRSEQLRMMFSCCHPRLSEAARVALILDILSGFGANEIASAFLTGLAAVEKRISRGKKVLADSKRLFDLDDADFASRLSAVRRALYLLFNEGYHGASAGSTVRVELCGEAMHLTALLREHAPAAGRETNALAALMCLHAARLPARVDAAGDLKSLFDQDRSRWDARLVARGLAFLERSAAGHGLTAYHIEAAIAATHAGASCTDETDWVSIVSLYDRLMTIAPSPVVALNRAIAVGQRDGAERGLEALRSIADRDRLAGCPFYPAAMGDLELRRGHRDVARDHFSGALSLARNPAERHFLGKRMRACAGE